MKIKTPLLILITLATLWVRNKKENRGIIVDEKFQF